MATFAKEKLKRIKHVSTETKNKEARAEANCLTAQRNQSKSAGQYREARVY